MMTTVTISIDFARFLLGEQPLNGAWFGERKDGESGLYWWRKELRAALAQGEAQPVAWRDHVEQRIRAWKQRTMNRSGDMLGIDDFMGSNDIDDLVDYVCDEYAEPPAPPPPAAPCPHIRSSGTGDWATHWCSLNGPAAPEISEAQACAILGAAEGKVYTALTPTGMQRARDVLAVVAALEAK